MLGDHDDTLVASHMRWMRRRNQADTSIAKRRVVLNMVKRELGGLATLNSERIEAWLDAKRLAPTTRYQYVSHLSTFYTWGIDHGLLDHNPTDRVVRPRTPARKPRPIGTADLRVAIDMASPMMRAWLCLMAYAGLRCVEVARLCVEDLHTDDDVVLIHGKGDKDRLLPIHPEIARSLQVHGLPRRGPVFVRPRGGPWPAARISREVSLYLEGLDIAATAHQIRHWFGTQTYKASRDLRVVQEMMGHSTPQTTAGYADWSRAEAKRTIESLAVSGDDSPSLFADWAS